MVGWFRGAFRAVASPPTTDGRVIPVARDSDEGYPAMWLEERIVLSAGDEVVIASAQGTGEV